MPWKSRTPMQWPVQASRPAGYAPILAGLSETLSYSYGHFHAPRAIATSLSNSYAQVCKAGERLVNLPAHCQLTYGERTNPDLMRLIERVPQEFWGAKLALQVRLTCEASTTCICELCGVHMDAARHLYRPRLSGRRHEDCSWAIVDSAREDTWDSKLLQVLHQQPASCGARHPALLHPGGCQGSGGVPATQVFWCMHCA